MQDWLVDKLQSRGVQIDQSPPEVPSLVLGRIDGVEGSTKTILVYSHYDVQPVSDFCSKSSVTRDEPSYVLTETAGRRKRLGTAKRRLAVSIFSHTHYQW